MSATIAPHDLQRLLCAEHDDPFAVLGLHQVGDELVLRAFRPEAKSLAVLDRHDPSRRFAADRVAAEGFFKAVIGEGVARFDYLLEVTTWKGESVQFADPYSSLRAVPMINAGDEFARTQRGIGSRFPTQAVRLFSFHRTEWNLLGFGRVEKLVDSTRAQSGRASDFANR